MGPGEQADPIASQLRIDMDGHIIFRLRRRGRIRKIRRSDQFPGKIIPVIVQMIHLPVKVATTDIRIAVRMIDAFEIMHDASPAQDKKHGQE